MRYNQLHLILSSLVLTTCSIAGGKLGPGVPVLHLENEHVVQSSELHCHGNVRIFLDGAAEESSARVLHKGVSIHSAKHDGKKSTFVKGRSAKNHEGYDVIFSGKNLLKDFTSIHMSDACTLEAVGLNMDALKLLSNTTGSITLRGTYKAGHIQQLKNNIIDAYWIDSDFLEIDSQAGRMLLAGTAKHVRAHATGKAFLSLDSLRASNLWLAGYGNSFVRFFGDNIQLSSFMNDSARAESLGYPLLVNDQSRSHGVLVYHLPHFEPIQAANARVGKKPTVK